MAVAIAGGLGLAFLGYCVYFDCKRRSDPDFKKKLRDRRRKVKQAQIDKMASNYPDLTDEQAVQRFFMTEIQLGEQLLATGDIENGIEHLANAVAVTPQKENILGVLRSSLPDQFYSMLCERLPLVAKKIYDASMFKKLGQRGKQESNGGGRGLVQISEEELAIDDCLD